MKQIFNPFLPEDAYIPDGEPHVFGDRLYLFGSHDMEDGESFCMLDYEGWSAPLHDLGAWESHGSDYSRQACAEPITMKADGSIEQAEMTSCGLNGAPLRPEGIIPATKACNLTNGKMPHIGNTKYEGTIPRVTNRGNEHYIAGITDDTLVGFKYFAFPDGMITLTVYTRGNGTGKLAFYVDAQMETMIAGLEVTPQDNWTQQQIVFSAARGVRPIYLKYSGSGEIELLQIEMSVCRGS